MTNAPTHFKPVEFDQRYALFNRCGPERVPGSSNKPDNDGCHGSIGKGYSLRKIGKPLFKPA